MYHGTGRTCFEKTLLYQSVCREGRPEIDPEADFRAQYILWIAAVEIADVPSGFAEDGVGRKAPALEIVHRFDAFPGIVTSKDLVPLAAVARQLSVGSPTSTKSLPGLSLEYALAP